MTRLVSLPHVIVNDASCLIDLRKGQILQIMLSLPYRFVVPFPIRYQELLDFTDEEWQMLDAKGLETLDLPPELVTEAFSVKKFSPQLSANDCLCLVSTYFYTNAILLTGDAALRRVAKEKNVTVHGVLWVFDRLTEASLCNHDLLIVTLQKWQADPTVFLPKSEIEKRLRLLSNS